jgi:glucose/mannose-6-phosphate isomerase
MSSQVDETRLDDVAAVEAADPAGMLRAVATSGAQVRQAAALATEAGLRRLAEDGRPRAVVVIGMGGSGFAGDVLAAVAGPTCPIPLVTHKAYGLPAWVGAADLVIAVSCSGGTEETLTGTDEAIRRGCRLLVVAGPDSPLAERAVQARAPHVPVAAAGRQPRANVWALSVPLLVAAAELGLVQLPAAAVEATAARLEQISLSCRPASESFVNPGKELALELAGVLPMVWGGSPVAAVAAARTVTQLAENAKSPAVVGVLPEANHNQVVAFDGPYGRLADPDDLFRDRLAGEVGDRLRLVLLRDPDDEHPQVQLRARISADLARERGIAVSELTAEGGSRLERLASLVGRLDYASVYLALALGIDPTPIAPIVELKERTRG